VRNLTVEVETNSKDTDSDTKTLRITTSVDPTPFVSTNTGLTVNEGATGPFLTSDLKSSDMDTYDELLQYTITTATINGQVENTDNPGTPITTFTQQDISYNKIVYVHDATETVSDTFNFNVSDGTNTLTNQSFAITIIPINDAPTITANTGRTLLENETISITTAHLSSTDSDSTVPSLVYNVTSGTANGQLENTDATGVAITSFTQQNLIDSKIQYVHDGSNTTTDSFVFTVTDGFDPLTGQTFAIAVTPVNDDIPTVSSNIGRTVAEDGTVSITDTHLNVTDADSLDSTLIINITTASENGQLENTDTPGVATSSFTLQNLIDGKIRYIHSGSETTSDSFGFSISDGTNELTGQTFAITITPVNDIPAIVVNIGRSFPESGSASILTLHLSATDSDSTDANLIFNITTAPINGQLENTDSSGIAISSFTQQDLIDGKIKYIHDGGDTTSDSFIFNVSDGIASLTGQTFNIRDGGSDAPIATLSDVPPAITNATIYNVQVGGIGVVSYRYKLDDEVAWSGETDIDTAINFNLSSEGEHTLHVFGKDISGLWQDIENATTYTWQIDTTPPVARITNAPEGTVGVTSAELNISGSIEEAVAYKFRVDGGDWSTQRSINTSITISDLEDGTYVVEVIAMDAAGNWQAEGSATEKEWTVDTSEYELQLSGIPDDLTSETIANITVSGENIVAYMYSLDGGTWTYGIVSELIGLTDLADGEHILKVRGLLEEGDVGDTGEGAHTRSWIVDTEKAVTTDLAAEAGIPSATAADLSWTWSSDNTTEVIKKYYLWYSTTAITEANLNGATEVYCNLNPSAEGITERFTVKKLKPGTLYYFAIKSSDQAGNISELSNVAELTTADSLPTVTNLVLVAGGNSADNSVDRDITVTGTQFVGLEGDNIIRFENKSSVFDIHNTSGSATEMSATVPVGAPVGTYSVRVINKYGISLPLSNAYTVTEAANPIPEVTNLSPQIVASGISTSVIVTGANFTAPIVGVWIVAKDGTQTAVSGITAVTAEQLEITLDIPTGFPEGLYDVIVENSNNLSNSKSAVQIEIVAPISIINATGPVVTTGIVEVTSGLVPVQTELKTDDRDEVEPVSSFPVEISIVVEPGSIFEENVSGSWADYTGLINPPREIPLTSAVSSQLGNYSSEFTIGADNPLHLKNGDDILMTLEITVPIDAPIPSIYYVSPTGRISTAGNTGTRDGIDYIPGGTILSTRQNIPEDGYVTYTIGALVNELGNHYAAGFRGNTDRYGPCFIESASGSMFSPLLFLIAVTICAAFRLKKGIAFFIAALVITGYTGQSNAEDSIAEKWYILAGGGYQQISEKNNSLYYGTNQTLTVDNSIYPLVRGGWLLNRRIALEAGFRYERMSGRMQKSQDGKGYIEGISLLAGPVYRFDKRNSKLIGEWTPFIKGDLGFKKIQDGLAYAVKDYDPTYGVEFAVGMLKGPLDLRLGYAYYTHDTDTTAAGVTGSSSTLGLSGVFMEVAYRFTFGDKIQKKKAVYEPVPEVTAVEKDETPLKDSDADGTPDDRDLCPETPPETDVTDDGCPVPPVIEEVIDTDADGTPDDKDLCPGTPPETDVTNDGCPVDTDNDGVADYLDICPDSPKGATIDERGCWRLKGIQFDVSRSAIKPAMHEILQDVMKILTENPALQLEIQGYTDNSGNNKMNQKLSEERANSVRDYLIKQGIDQNRLTAKGYGEKNPAVANDTAENRAVNRRIEVIPVQ